MSDSIVITSLVENTVNIGGLCAEHGLAFLIRAGGRKILFDTGQTDLLLTNSRKMGLPLEDVESIVLSHGHYDHTGGLSAIGGIAPRARLFAHPAALAPKFTANADRTSRFIGASSTSVAVFNEVDREVIWTSNPTEIRPGIFATGEIPRVNEFEDVGGRFYLDADCCQPDPLLDDQALFFDSADGLVVILGCAHSGVVNTVEYILAINRARPLFALIGGLHLLTASPDRMKQTIAALQRWAPRKIIPGHCTGQHAISQIWSAFPDRCAGCPVGTSFRFHQ